MRRPYERPMPSTWWLQRWPYTLFMLRELSSVFIAIYMVILVLLVHKLDQGAELYHGFVAALRSPLAVLFHLIALAFAMLHSITWFNLAPKVMVIRRGEERVPAGLVAGINYAGWIVVSVVVTLLLLA